MQKSSDRHLVRPLHEEPASRPHHRLTIRRANRSDMADAADNVRSKSDGYRPILSSRDMRDDAVDARWASRNHLRRELHVGCLRGETVGTPSLQHCGEYLYIGHVYLLSEEATGASS